VLSDSDLRTLREMQRRLSAEDPDFVRRFGFPDPCRPAERRRRARLRMILTEMIAALTIMDPQPLTGTQADVLSTIPAPRRRTL